MTGEEPRPSRSRLRPVAPFTALGVTVLAALAGGWGWPRPDRTLTGWQVTAVPASLLVLLVGAALVCVASAVAVTPRACLGGLAARAAVWSAVVLSVAAQVWNDLYFAAMSADTGPIMLRLFTFVPALVATVVTRRLGRRAQFRAALGTGVATVPMVALGGALYRQTEGLLTATIGGVYTAVVFGVLPIVVAVAVLRSPDGEPATAG